MRLNMVNYGVFMMILSITFLGISATSQGLDLRDIGSTSVTEAWQIGSQRNSVIGLDDMFEKATDVEEANNLEDKFQNPVIETENFDIFDKFVNIGYFIFYSVGTFMSLLLLGWIFVLPYMALALGPIGWMGQLIVIIIWIPLIYTVFKFVLGGKMKI